MWSCVKGVDMTMHKGSKLYFFSMHLGQIEMYSSTYISLMIQGLSVLGKVRYSVVTQTCGVLGILGLFQVMWWVVWLQACLASAACCNSCKPSQPWKPSRLSDFWTKKIGAEKGYQKGFRSSWTHADGRSEWLSSERACCVYLCSKWVQNTHSASVTGFK